MNNQYGGARRWGKTKRGNADIEHQLQVSQISWCEWQSLVWPELESIFAVPNQAKRGIAGYTRMNSEGLKKGQWDLCLPVPRRGFGALFIENKCPIVVGKKKTKLSPAQIKRGHILEAAGNLCYVIRTYDDFVNLVTWYIGQEDPLHPVIFSRGKLWEYEEGAELEY